MSEEEFRLFGVKQSPPKIYHTCTFQGLGTKRQDYIDQVANVVINKGCKVFDKRVLGWMESHVIGGADLLFESPNKILVTGIRAVSIDSDLRVGFVSPRRAKRYLAFFFIFMVLALSISFIPILMWGATKIAALTWFSIFIVILCVPLVYMVGYSVFMMEKLGVC